MSVDIQGSKISIYAQTFEQLDRLEFFLDVKVNHFAMLHRKTIDFCKFLKSPRSEMMIYYVYQELYKGGLKVDKCPVQPVIFVFWANKNERKINLRAFFQIYSLIV